MTELNNIQTIYFIGIGGIGMSALARYFKFHGITVSGYDKTETTLTSHLINEGIPVHFTDEVNRIPKKVDLVVYTPAIPSTHKELSYYRDNNYRLMKRSEVLGLITSSSFNICVAGTHGKTTVSTMIAHILRDSGFGCNAFLGGISTNYQTNYWSDKRNVCVVEADEYDRSFLKLNPDVAVITAMDADHLDIYGTESEVQSAFIDFSARVKPGGLLISKAGLKREKELVTANKLTYSLSDYGGDAWPANIQVVNGNYQFDVIIRDWTLHDVMLQMGGLHNIENVTAAIAVAHHIGIADDLIKKAVADFKGVKRRFEYIIRNKKHVFIDDYAHHPEELRMLLSSVKSLFDGLSCTIVFQPHLFTRTRDFADAFGAALDLADHVYLLPVYPARELPIEGVDSAMITRNMQHAQVYCCSKEEMIESISKSAKAHGAPELLITAGAGDIDKLVEPLSKILNAN